MPSATETMIAAQAIGAINRITPPEYSAAYTSMEGINAKFSYSRPDQKVYQGKTVTDSIMSDIMYSSNKRELHNSKNKYIGLNREQEEKGLYQAVMLDLYR